MTTERDVPNAASSTDPGPALLSERPLLGVFVHVIGLLTGIVGPGILYLVSDREFTRTNARNVFNWQLLVFTAFLVVMASVFGWILVVEWTPIPDVLALGWFLLIFVAMLGLVIVTLLNLIFPLVATAKAIFGDAWTYPLTPDFLAWIASYVDR
ncbi:DUF4870 domain-containing protein [Natrialba sp. INN-245]|uniref:DUF4870 domain-containing protein n=1 Tax=Natrialba sp. INN-245 TaxID=2690967 RepID=UPI001310C235|nr:DUF4870 domain-containing protein [Natrialba sp. INN-245]MWV41063.1 DUF4870 domain-containing protein [Natrialba sp. INN-245]